jgi:hypothetical protein
MRHYQIHLPETFLIKLIIILAIIGLIGIIELLIWLISIFTEQSYALFGLTI